VRQWDLFDKQQLEQTETDLLWSFAAFATVFSALWVITGSFLIAAGGMAGVALSFPLAFFVYRAIFGIAWVGLLNLLGVFLIAGIGADDIFVVWEHWKQAPFPLHAANPDEVSHWSITKNIPSVLLLVTHKAYVHCLPSHRSHTSDTPTEL
jgi:hypothetical protein